MKKKKRNNTALDVMANPTQQGAYTRAHASFSEIAELAKTEEEVQIFLDGLANIRGKLMATKAASSNAASKRTKPNQLRSCKVAALSAMALSILTGTALSVS